MIYTFIRSEVQALIDITEAAPKCHVPYTGGDWGVPEKTDKGLMLVGDEGVYLMSNATDLKVGENGKLPTAFAREANPSVVGAGAADDAKRDGFGGDDGVEFLALEDVKAWLLGTSAPLLKLKINEKEFSFVVGVKKK